jgi:hypothetical protein
MISERLPRTREGVSATGEVKVGQTRPKRKLEIVRTGSLLATRMGLPHHTAVASSFSPTKTTTGLNKTRVSSNKAEIYTFSNL